MPRLTAAFYSCVNRDRFVIRIKPFRRIPRKQHESTILAENHWFSDESSRRTPIDFSLKTLSLVYTNKNSVVDSLENRTYSKRGKKMIGSRAKRLGEIRSALSSGTAWVDYRLEMQCRGIDYLVPIDIGNLKIIPWRIIFAYLNVSLGRPRRRSLVVSVNNFGDIS